MKEIRIKFCSGLPTYTTAEVTSGLTDHAIEDILRNCETIRRASDLPDVVALSSSSMANEVLKLIREILDNPPELKEKQTIEDEAPVTALPSDLRPLASGKAEVLSKLSEMSISEILSTSTQSEDEDSFNSESSDPDEISP